MVFSKSLDKSGLLWRDGAILAENLQKLIASPNSPPKFRTLRKPWKNFFYEAMRGIFQSHSFVYNCTIPDCSLPADQSLAGEPARLLHTDGLGGEEITFP
jgi:hypothetical protein